jgi:branched-chain amino acid transport system substrate-binding protein
MWHGKTWLAVAGALTLALAAALPGCGGGGGQGSAVKIGSLESKTGDTATFGTSTENGIVLAMEERNQAGGVLGKPIELVIADDQSKQEQVRQAVLKLIDQDHVCAILGEVASGRTAAAAPDCQKAKVPLLSPSSTRDDVTEAGDYVFRSCFTDRQQGSWIVQVGADLLHAKKAALLVDIQSPYSVGLAKVIREEFAKKGGTIVKEESYSGQNKDYQTQLTNIRGADPELVFLPGYYSEIVNILPQARKLGITVPFVGGDGWDSDDTLNIGKDAVNGCYFTNHYSPQDPDPKVVEFVRKFQARFGRVPDAMAVTGYDAANLLFDAIQRAGSTEGPKIRDALAATRDFPGVTGKITIGPDRNAIKPGVVVKIENGHFTLFSKIGETPGK